jgi:hypothetical protein
MSVSRPSVNAMRFPIEITFASARTGPVSIVIGRW